MTPNHNQLPGSPIFVVGFVHTGTSLLKTILKRNAAVWPVTGETHFFQDLAKIKREFAGLDDAATRRAYIVFLIKLAYLGHKRGMWKRDEWTLADFGLNDTHLEEVLATTADTNDHAVLFGRVNDCLTAFAGKRVWVEKTPEHVYFLDQVLRARPDAKVIELVRDPRATLASRKLRRTDEWLDAKEEKESLEVDRTTNYDPLLDSLMWKEAVNAGRDARRNYPSNVLTVRYEDLAHDPETTLLRICEFTGLTFTEDMLDVGWVNAATQMQVGGTAPTVQSKAGVSTRAIDKWKKTLPPAEIFLSQSLLRTEMRELEYQPFEVGLGPRVKAPLLLGGTVANLARRLGKNRPGQVPERARDAFDRTRRRLFKGVSSPH
jgi:hypothetical protein